MNEPNIKAAAQRIVYGLMPCYRVAWDGNAATPEAYVEAELTRLLAEHRQGVLEEAAQACEPRLGEGDNWGKHYASIIRALPAPPDVGGKEKA